MKRGRVFVSIVFLSIILICGFLSAATNATANTTEAKGYKCLENKLTETPCDALSGKTSLFYYLSMGKCRSEIVNAINEEGCYTEGSSCTLKNNAIALLAFKERKESITSVTDWLLNQTDSPNNLEWYLQIETYGEKVDCTVSYDTSSQETLSIEEDYTVSGGGTCFRVLDSDPYKFLISPDNSCLDKDFLISCSNPKGFLTSLLFKKIGATKIGATNDKLYIAEESESSSSATPTTEKVNSQCFLTPGTSTCDYEGTLWGAVAMSAAGKDVSAYMPYLIATAEDNSKYFPEAFLSKLTGYETYTKSVQTKLLSAGYWAIAGSDDSIYFNTALAVYLVYPGKASTQTKSWVQTQQQATSGCWNNEDRIDTAFLLYALWNTYKGTVDPLPPCTGVGCGPTQEDCLKSNYYCANSKLECADVGTVKEGYYCSRAGTCCTANPDRTCSELGGIICTSSQICSGTEKPKASGMSMYESCCIGTCTAKPIVTKNDCEKDGGTCDSSCSTGYEEDTSLTDSCDSGKCCVESATSPTTKKTSYWWVWVLLVLIVLVILGIVFKDKLKPLFDKIKGGSGSSSKPSSPSGFSSQNRTILPPRQPMQQQRQSPGQMDDVLKKLREMGK
jgi:hypothetical protein